MTQRSTRKKIRKWALRLLSASTILLVASYSPKAHAQISNTTNVQGVDVTLSLDKTKISVGEPVILNITLENISPQPLIDILANFQLSEGNNLEVTVQPAGELEYRYAGAFEAGTYPGITSRLLSRSPKSLDTLLLYDGSQPSGLLFSKPGTYELAVNFQFRLGGKTELSNASLPAVQIEVSPAAGPQQEILKLLNEPNHIRALHLGVIPTTATLPAIENAAIRYPDTWLGSLATRAQGYYYARGNGTDIKRGVKLLQKFLTDNLVPVDQDGTAWTLLTAYHINKQYDRAREWAFTMVRNFPASLRIRAEDALLYYYYFAPADFAAGVPWYVLKAPWIVPNVELPTDLKPRESTQ